MVTGGEVVGAFYLTGEQHDRAFGPEDRELMAVLAAHAAVAVDNARLLEVSRDTAITQERARLSRELHDAVAQSVFGLRLTARAAVRHIRTDPEAAARDLSRIEELATSALRELRAAIEQLQPPDLGEHGLAAAISSHAELLGRGWASPVRVSTDPPPQDPSWRSLDAVAPAVLRIVQEALANATRHASATNIGVDLRLNPSEGGGRGGARLEAVVTDDGVGFDTDSTRRRGLGLVSMRERAESVGAALDIDARPAAGTTVRVSVVVPS
jgi:signal transduction histidine kinase